MIGYHGADAGGLLGNGHQRRPNQALEKKREPKASWVSIR